MKSIHKYCQEDIDYCFKKGMVLCQFNYKFSETMFGFLLNAHNSDIENLVAVWKLKSLKNK